MTKIVLSFILGMMFILIIAFAFGAKLTFKTNYNSILKLDTIQTIDSLGRLYNDVSSDEIGILDERIESLNKRFDDLYVLGGIIVMLLLAITVSVYIKAESDVEKHFNVNYEKYKKQVINYVNDAEGMIEKVKTELDLVSKIRQTLEADKKETTQEKKPSEPQQS